NWWQGAAWNLTNPSWSLEVGMPWPGISTPTGTSFTQIWEMDNLKITMIPEPASLILLGLGALSVVKKRN
ncbi:MAG TPA: PEP-CTERM sorting domain-containing protein, partial [Anaerohalosphaeraceae bacterium]|nr:PEP-CTERM sorting domain-containing protein [Anaerohalosphaeraceae bacterium]